MPSCPTWLVTPGTKHSQPIPSASRPSSDRLARSFLGIYVALIPGESWQIGSAVRHGVTEPIYELFRHTEARARLCTTTASLVTLPVGCPADMPTTLD